MNVPPKDSLMHSLLRDNIIDKLAVRIIGTDFYLGGAPDENSANLTYTVNDKWSLPFDIVCFDSNCTEYYNNKYPVLIEPTTYLCLIPYEYMELIKKKYYNEEFKIWECYYNYDYDRFNKFFRIKCQDTLKELSLIFLYNNKGIRLKNIESYHFYSIENYSNWLLNKDVLNTNYYLDYEAKTITLYDNLVEFPNRLFRNIKNIGLIKVLFYSMLVLLLIGLILISSKLIHLCICEIIYTQR